MHLYLQFNGRFTRKADRVARIFAERYGFDRFSGVSTSEGHARWLQKQGHTPINYHHVQPLPDLWRAALNRPAPSAERLRELEIRYGNLWRFIIADRNLGHTFLTGTIFPDSELRRRAADLNVVMSCMDVLFGYFEEQFSRDRPDLVFFQVVASSPALIASAVCGRYEIPFLTLGKTKLDDRHHVASNALMQADPVIERYADPSLVVEDSTRARIVKSREEPFASDHFAADRKNFQQRHGGSFWDLVTTQAKSLGKALKPYDKPYPPDPRASTPWETWLWETRVKWNYRQLVRSGIFDRQKVDGDYLFLALSVTPEASTCVVAPNFADQLTVVSALARNLPAGWKLVVKDHLPMCGRRTRAFYDLATQYQNVLMVDPTLRSTELIRNARVTAVIASTSGWESMMMGRPVITFGPVWYLATGMGVHCRNIEYLHDDIFRAIALSESFSPEERERRCARMMQALFDGSFPWSYEMMWKGFSDKELDARQEELERLAREVFQRFEKIRKRSQVPAPFDCSAWTRDRTPATDAPVLAAK